MAAKKKSTSKKRSVRPVSNESLRTRIVQMALDIAATESWAAVTLPRLAKDLNVPLGQVIAACPTRTCIVLSVVKGIDQTVLENVSGNDAAESPRDRLFEVMMMRFDALQSHRDGHAALIRHVRKRPAALLVLGPQLLHSMALMLIASGIGTEGLIGALRVKALAAAYGSVMRTWLKDDSKDMAATMSALDKVLGRLESAARMMQRRKSKAKPKKKKS